MQMPPKQPGNYGTDSSKTHIKHIKGFMRRRLSIWRPQGLGFAVFPPLGGLPILRRLRRNVCCGQNLSEDEVPREIALVDTLVRTPEGDVDPLALCSSRLDRWPSHCGIGENSMDRKRSRPPGREQIEERSSFQKWILLNENLKALLRQELFNFL
jgi:hypothetical protein